jgi:hypothetical protein
MTNDENFCSWETTANREGKAVLETALPYLRFCVCEIVVGEEGKRRKKRGREDNEKKSDERKMLG